MSVITKPRQQTDYMDKITMYSDNTLGINGRHIGSVKQEDRETVFFRAMNNGKSERIALCRRYTLSNPKERAKFDDVILAIMRSFEI